MSDARLRILDRAYETWNAYDFEAWVQCWDEDVEYDVSALFWDTPPVRGRAGMARWAPLVLRQWESYQMELLETVEVGPERIVQRVRAHGTSPTGLAFEQTILQIFDYAGGDKPVRGRLFPEG